MGITKLSGIAASIPDEGCGGCAEILDTGTVVRVGGITSKPELNGKARVATACPMCDWRVTITRLSRGFYAIVT